MPQSPVFLLGDLLLYLKTTDLMVPAMDLILPLIEAEIHSVYELPSID